MIDDGSMDKKRKVRSFLVALLTSVLTGWFPIVFLYAKENENTKGLIDTGMNLVKNGREISFEKKTMPNQVREPSLIRRKKR